MSYDASWLGHPALVIFSLRETEHVEEDRSFRRRCRQHRCLDLWLQEDQGRPEADQERHAQVQAGRRRALIPKLDQGNTQKPRAADFRGPFHFL